eukprot:Pgem_evm1s97
MQHWRYDLDANRYYWAEDPSWCLDTTSLNKRVAYVARCSHNWRNMYWTINQETNQLQMANSKRYSGKYHCLHNSKDKLVDGNRIDNVPCDTPGAQTHWVEQNDCFTRAEQAAQGLQDAAKDLLEAKAIAHAAEKEYKNALAIEQNALESYQKLNEEEEEVKTASEKELADAQTARKLAEEKHLEALEMEKQSHEVLTKAHQAITELQNAENQAKETHHIVGSLLDQNNKLDLLHANYTNLLEQARVLGEQIQNNINNGEANTDEHLQRLDDITFMANEALEQLLKAKLEEQRIAQFLAEAIGESEHAKLASERQEAESEKLLAITKEKIANEKERIQNLEAQAAAAQSAKDNAGLSAGGIAGVVVGAVVVVALVGAAVAFFIIQKRKVDESQKSIAPHYSSNTARESCRSNHHPDLAA